jgi:hypothetical protein
VNLSRPLAKKEGGAKMRLFWVVPVVVFLVSVSGCAKNDAQMEPSQELMSLEDLSSPTVEGTAVVTDPEPMAAAKIEPALPPGPPYKPTSQQIQQALKHAGFYTGNVDGKMGPMTKEAIEEFQKTNNLEADGKVGPKTWSLLSKHLETVPPSQPPAQ